MFENNYHNRNKSLYSSTSEIPSYGMSAELFKHIAMVSPFGHAITATNEKDAPIVYVNRSFEKITGYEASEVVGRSCQFLLGEDQEQDSLLRLQEAIEKGEHCTEVVLNYRRDRSLFYNELTVYPVFDDKAEITYLVWVTKDVTASIEAEKKMTRILAEKDKRFSAYVENSNQAHWRIDFNPPIPLDDPHEDQIQAVFNRGVFTEANDTTAREYGLYRGVDLIGRPLNRHMDGSRPENYVMVANLVRNGFILEYAMTH